MGIFPEQKGTQLGLRLAQHCTKQTKTPFCTIKLTVQKMTVSPGSGGWTRAVLGQGGGGRGVRPPCKGTTPALSQVHNTPRAACTQTHSPPVLQYPYARHPGHCHLPSAHHTISHHTTPCHTTTHHAMRRHTSRVQGSGGTPPCARRKMKAKPYPGPSQPTCHLTLPVSSQAANPSHLMHVQSDTYTTARACLCTPLYLRTHSYLWDPQLQFPPSFCQCLLLWHPPFCSATAFW